MAGPAPGADQPNPRPRRPAHIQKLAIFLRPNPNEKVPLFSQPLPDWSRAGPARILAGFCAAIKVEDVLGNVLAELTIVHADYDQLTRFTYAASLAVEFGGAVRIAPAGAHSRPTGDTRGFLRLVADLTRVRR